jgi:hypothetical protein
VSVVVFTTVTLSAAPAAADDTEYTALALGGAFSILVSGGVAVANAVGLVRGVSSRPNGWFGVGIGTFSVVFATTVVIAAEGEGTSREFAAVLGSAGAASVVFGALSVRAAGEQRDPVEAAWHVSIKPRVEGGRLGGFGVIVERSL